jgi:hypothetical protein
MPQPGVSFSKTHWNRVGFAREQIRGLVRQVFFGGDTQAVKHVVFCSLESHTDVSSICGQVGRALALETHADIAIVVRDRTSEQVERNARPDVGHAAIKSRAMQMGGNLWRVPDSGLDEPGEEAGTGRYWSSHLAELRHEFEYVIIHGPVAGASSEAALLGQLADGMILVLDAHSTRGAMARKVKQTLEGSRSRILGTVLSERAFPVPEPIYRRL